MTHHTRATGLAGAACTIGCLMLPAPAGAQVLTLSDALDAVLATHPSLAAAEARVLAAADASEVARATRLPSAALTATFTQFQEPMVVAPLHTLNLVNPPAFDRSLVQGQLSARYTIFDGGARSSRIRSADALHEAAGAASDATEMRLIEQTVEAYLDIVTARTTLEAGIAQVAALTEERDRARHHVEAGSAAHVEVLRTEAVLQEARAEEATSRVRVGVAERTLARFMNTQAENVASRALVPIAPRGTSAPDDGIASPALRQADRSVMVAEAHLAEERAGRLPEIHVGAGLQDFASLAGRHVVEWRAGIEFAWPLFTGGAQSAAVQRATLEVSAARSDLEATRLQVALEVDASAAAVVEADARVEALAAAVAQWEEVARIEVLAVDAGSGEQRDLLRAQAGLFQARAGRAIAERDAVLTRIRLARVGGALTREWLDRTMGSR